MWIDIRGPIVADTVYVDGKLVAKDVAFTLPEVSPKTSTFAAMGDVEMPVPGNINAMEATITKIGVDKGLGSMVKLQSKILEIRFVHDVKKGDGTTKVEGCKAFMRCTPRGSPGSAARSAATARTRSPWASLATSFSPAARSSG